MPGLTPSQTVGPFFEIGLVPAAYGFRPLIDSIVASPETPGDHIVIEGRVLDGDGAGVPDAMVEIWQADHKGRYAHPDDGRPLASNSFRGFGRSGTDENGAFRFETIKPGATPGPNGTTQAPHINVSVFARGILKRMFTRIYFPNEPLNRSDPILALVPAERRDTLVARPDPSDAKRFRFDIRLQGGDETVFFAA
jgi:protocatechuate 3,4-dioxygenase alpha subunit